ncbi:hypothetical protein GCM10020219_090780 [Nonomuraea dietziae]
MGRHPRRRCFGDCFAAACTRAGFTPSTMYETDVATCVHLAQVGRAVVLCQATHPLRPGPGDGAARGRSAAVASGPRPPPASPCASWVAEHAKAAHADAVRRSPVYHDWLVRNPGWGTSP